MGAWGTSLYANDTASDIRGDYLDGLRRGKGNEEVTRGIIESNRDIIGDPEEEPLLWYALADTQWGYGRLMPEVRDKALSMIGLESEMGRWREAGGRQAAAWEATLSKLRERLLSEPPPEKRVYEYRLYRCRWAMGDIFAYRLGDPASEGRGVMGRHLAFRKVTEDIWWPGHVAPVVNVFDRIWDGVPTLEEAASTRLLVQKHNPLFFEQRPGREKEYLFKIAATREKAIPKDRLTFLGNVPGDDLFGYPGFDDPEQKFFMGYAFAEWKDFEKRILDQYFAWNPEG
jgi:hypothetical protein